MKLNPGERVAGISAILLFAVMFLNWFGVKSSDSSLSLFTNDRNAWEAFDYNPVLLIAVVATLAEVVLRLASSARRFAAATNAVVAVLGTISTLLILFRIVDPPNFGSLPTSFGVIIYEGTILFPIFLALAAACGISYGGYRAMREAGRSAAPRAPHASERGRGDAPVRRPQRL